MRLCVPSNLFTLSVDLLDVGLRMAEPSSEATTADRAYRTLSLEVFACYGKHRAPGTEGMTRFKNRKKETGSWSKYVGRHGAPLTAIDGLGAADGRNLPG